MRKKALFLSIGVGLLVCGELVSADLLGLVEQHFVLSTQILPTSTTSLSSQNQKNLNSDLWFLFDQSENFLQTDLTQLLSQEPRTRILDEYIMDGNSLQSALQSHNAQLTSEISQSKSQLESCEATLSQANQSYQSALSNNQESSYLAALEQAKQARTCMGTAYVTLNSAQTLQSKLNHYLQQIARRTDYLQGKRSLIIQHYDVLNQQLLSELQALSVQLDSTRQ